MSIRYTNAKDILPEELIEQVRNYYPGGTLYFPSEHEPGASRQLVLDLAAQKLNSKEIAVLVGLTPRRVNQILAENRQQSD